MKTPIFVFFAVFASALVAESQTPKSIPAAKPAAAAAEVVSDEIPLADDEGGKVELTSSGDTVNIVCEDASISDILRQFRRVVKANILSTDSTNLHKRVSISLYDTPWVDSLKAVLGMGGFALDERNGIYRVSPEQAENPIVRTKSFTLNHANADETAKLLNESFGEKDKKTGKLIGGVASVFKDANVIVVKGTDKMIRDCEDVIASVDKAPEQVYIEARFIQLTSEAMHKLGINWEALQGYRIEAKNITAGFEANGGSPNNFGEGITQRSKTLTSQSQGNMTKTTGGDTSSQTDTTSTQSQNNDNPTYKGLFPDTIGDAAKAGATAASMGWKNAYTFSGQLSPADFALTLSAFEQESDAKMFSNPRIIVSNGKQAQVDMTTKYPNVRVTASRTGSYGGGDLDITAQLEQIPGEEGALFAKDVFFSWGISLAVTPRISPDGLINVEIVPMISDRSSEEGGWAKVEGAGTSGAVYSKYPIIDVQRLVTDFTMKDGSTAVIGGLTQTKEEDVDSGIPYLRKIPWIGPRLFGWKGREKVQKEIIVFVTVGIAHPARLKKDVGLPKNAVLGREYVEGKALEPGDRGGVKKAMELDMRDVNDEERHEKVKEPEPKVIEKIVEKPTAAPVAVAAASPEGPAKSDPTDPKQESTGPVKAFVPSEEPEPVVSEPARKIRHGRR